jgi:hypothetical protein
MYGQALNRGNYIFKSFVDYKRNLDGNSWFNKTNNNIRFNCTYDGDCFYTDMSDPNAACILDKNKVD